MKKGASQRLKLSHAHATRNTWKLPAAELETGRRAACPPRLELSHTSTCTLLSIKQFEDGRRRREPRVGGG